VRNTGARRYGVKTEAEARAAVRELAAKKVDLIKIWVDDRNGTVEKLTPPLYRAIIDEAHKNNLRVAAHIFYLADAKELLRSGIDIFAHGIRDQDVDDEVIALFKQHPNVAVIPNLPDRETTAADLSFAAETVPAAEIERMRNAVVTAKRRSSTESRPAIWRNSMPPAFASASAPIPARRSAGTRTRN